jgi:hypothetical protein
MNLIRGTDSLTTARLIWILDTKIWASWKADFLQFKIPLALAYISQSAQMLCNVHDDQHFGETLLYLYPSLSLSSTLETWEGVDFYKVVVVQELYNIMDKEPSNLFHMYRSYMCR